MKKQSKLIALILALVLIVSLCACGNTSNNDVQSSDQPSGNTPVVDGPTSIQSDAETVKKQTPAGQLVVGYNSEPDMLDPMEAARGGTTINNMIYEPLIYMNFDTGELEPWLITEWTYTDPTTLVMKLREGVYFTNGNPFTAEDVLYSLWRSVNSAKRGTQYTFINYDECYAEDDHTVVVKMNYESGAAIGYLATVYAMDKTFCEEVGIDALATQTCGTGPYIQKEWINNYGFEYVKNENYWGGVNVEVEFDSILLRYYSEETTMEIDFETGQIDMAVSVSDTEAENILAGNVEGANLWLAPGVGVYSLTLYDQYEPFKDARVRQAIACAVDWKVVAENALGVLGKYCTSIIPSGVMYHIDLPDHEYNPEKAKQLLAEAGYADGFEFLCVPTTGTFYTNVCETIQYYLGEVGINFKFEQYDFSTAITYWQGRDNNGVPVNQAGILNGSASAGDPDKILSTTKLGSGLTYVECNDERVQELLKTGAESADDAVRAEAYTELQEYMFEQCYQIPFAETINAYAAWNYLDNVPESAPGMPRICFITMGD